MDMLGFFSKLRKHTSFHRDDAEDENVPAPSRQDGDREDDGYLLVGQTQSERITVYGASFNSSQGINSPPDYGQATGELPSYSSVLNGECNIVSGPSNVISSSIEFSHLQRQDTISSRSVVGDVPFELHPSLAIHQFADSIFSDMDLKPHSFNWSKYSHDFMNEKLCLRDLNCDEEANIDDFLISVSSGNCIDEPNRKTEENLIQL